MATAMHTLVALLTTGRLQDNLALLKTMGVSVDTLLSRLDTEGLDTLAKVLTLGVVSKSHAHIISHAMKHAASRELLPALKKRNCHPAVLRMFVRMALRGPQTHRFYTRNGCARYGSAEAFQFSGLWAAFPDSGASYFYVDFLNHFGSIGGYSAMISRVHDTSVRMTLEELNIFAAFLTFGKFCYSTHWYRTYWDALVSAFRIRLQACDFLCRGKEMLRARTHTMQVTRAIKSVSLMDIQNGRVAEDVSLEELRRVAICDCDCAYNVHQCECYVSAVQRHFRWFKTKRCEWVTSCMR